MSNTSYRVSRTQNRLAFENRHYLFTPFERPGPISRFWGDHPTGWTDYCSGCPLNAGLCMAIRDHVPPGKAYISTVPCRPSRRLDGKAGWFKEVTNET